MPSHQPNRVYLPTNAHSNQYLLAEFKPDEQFYQAGKSVESCYQKLADTLYSLAEQHQLFNVQIIANDKLPVVRYHSEAHNLETEKQIRIFYNPVYHEGQNLFCTPEYQAKKIRIVFLATGNELRSQAAHFHQSVVALLTQLKNETGLTTPIKIRDHQHLSYDLFAAVKGHKESYGYKLRGLYPRYLARNVSLPTQHSEITYVTLTLPLSRQLKKQTQVESSTDHSALYQRLAEQFQTACSGKGLQRLAMVANGRTPLVRNSQVDQSEQNSELQKISFDPDKSEAQFIQHWQADNLVESAHFILVASKQDNTEMGYGRFMNHVEEALRSFCKQLQLDTAKQQLTVRFYQHISYLQ
ncbi:DUF3083 family protein [Arsukibacterium perlucidum]|uniref:DUF3083 family protein n=1 Tax=Arsukibacterium perlucidum TaxID=368811 RepID=UPI000382CE52|nr:DUF3083 family protein [Arsukibacterium perlucidum]